VDDDVAFLAGMKFHSWILTAILLVAGEIDEA
jgi:hypothetical protein